MGIKNPEVLYMNGCRAIILGEFCGKASDDPVHNMPGGHNYQD